MPSRRRRSPQFRARSASRSRIGSAPVLAGHEWDPGQCGDDATKETEENTVRKKMQKRRKATDRTESGFRDFCLHWQRWRGKRTLEVSKYSTFSAFLCSLSFLYIFQRRNRTLATSIAVNSVAFAYPLFVAATACCTLAIYTLAGRMCRYCPAGADSGNGIR